MNLLPLGRIGPKRLVNFLAKLVPPEPRGFLINFDLTASTPSEFREIDHAIRIYCGVIVNREQFGPAGGWPSWTVRFYREQSAEQFLRRFGLLSHGETVADYVVEG